MQATDAVAAQVAAQQPADALAAARRTLKAAGVKAEDGYELAFNVACAATAAGQLRDAEYFLDLADRLGQELLIGEDATQEVRVLALDARPPQTSTTLLQH